MECWLPDLASGDAICGSAISEPHAGRDVTSISTRAEKDTAEQSPASTALTSSARFRSRRHLRPVVNSFVQDDFIRATTFFALAFGLATVGGILLGDLRLGIEWGFPLGVAFGVFAYFFIAPAETDDTAPEE